MYTNILTKNLNIYEDCYEDKDRFWPREIRGSIMKNEVILSCQDVKELERLKDYIIKTMPKEEK